MASQNYQKLFTDLSEALDTFIREVKSREPDLPATDEWSVKEVLCHLVFWHENYAANYRALALKKEPPLLDGPGYQLNEQGVSALKAVPTGQLIDRLLKAQKSLYVSIVEKRVPRMTYKKAGRVFSTPEFLAAIAGHVRTHTRQVKRAK